MAQIARCAHCANASIHGVERLPAQNDGRLSMKPGSAFAWTKQTSQIFVSLPTPLCSNTELIRLVAVSTSCYHVPVMPLPHTTWAEAQACKFGGPRWKNLSPSLHVSKMAEQIFSRLVIFFLSTIFKLKPEEELAEFWSPMATSSILGLI